MRTKILVLAGCVALGLAAVAFSRGGAAVAYVLLQSSTPGTSEVGHVNITGTFRSSQMNATSLTATTTPVIGNNNAASGTSYGGSFSAASTAGTGVRSTATALSGSAKAVYAEARGASGRAVDCLASGVSGVALVAKATGTSGTAISAMSTGNGVAVSVFAVKTALVVSGGDQGVNSHAEFSSPGSAIHAGVYSQGTNYSIGTSYGVYGFATNNGAGTCYGVAGYGNGSGTDWGVYSYGNSGGTGTKSFEIDHPLSPETATLRHYSAEGAEPLLVYCGNVSLDSRGRAVVRLPEYVAAIGRDFRYQLTPLGAPMPDLYVSRLFASGSFSVAGGAPGQSVSWTLTGVRNDRWVQQNGAPIEVPKPAPMQGLYLEPKLYGKPAAAGVRGVGRG